MLVGAFYNWRRVRALLMASSRFEPARERSVQNWDAVDAWFDCIMQCPVEGGDDCLEVCIRTHLGDEEELWKSSLCC